MRSDGYDDDLIDIDLADRPMPSVRDDGRLERAIANVAFNIFTVVALFLIAALIAGIARGDQDVTAKPSRLTKLVTKLDAKKVIWKALGDVDLIDDSSGKYAVFLAPVPGKYPVMVIGAKGDEPLVEVITVTVEGEQPKPPPGPGPDPNPPDPKPPTPVKQTDVVLVVVEETANAMANRGQWIIHKAFFDLYSIPGVKIQTRIVDQDVKDASGQTPSTLAPYIARAKTAGIPQWFLVTRAGDLLGSGPVPASPEELANTIRKKAGW